MNEEQRAVLAAIAGMEESPGTLIDEYTVARAANILATDLAGNDYIQSAGRGHVHRVLDELEALNLLRLEREGFWRPRTTLSGRRALQRPLVAVPTVRPRARPGAAPTEHGATATSPAAAGSAADDGGPPTRRDTSGWPEWWPTALRFGPPALTPILVPIGVLLALLLVFLVGRAAVGGRAVTPTPTQEIAAALTATAAVQGPPTPTSAPGAGAGGAPTPAVPRTPVGTRVVPTPPAPPRPPTPTAGPAAKRLIVVNTDNLGANLYITPAGEKRLAVSEGSILEVIGPDERDTKGQNWKHIQWNNFEGWIPEEYTAPLE